MRRAKATRFRFDHRPETSYEARLGPCTIYGPVADEEPLYAVEIKFIVDAKLRDGRRSPPEGSIAKVVLLCNERLVPIKAEMRHLLTLLVGPLPEGSPIDWDKLISRRVHLRFGSPPAPEDRNPVLEFRLPSASDGSGQEGRLEPEQTDSLRPSPHEGEGAEDLIIPKPQRPAGDVSQNEPGALLRGWKDICRTLGLPPTQQRVLWRMNEKEGGPIKSFGRGRPPQVFKNALLEWWVDIERRAASSRQAQKARRLSFKNPLPYGRHGGAFYPEQAMHVKMRRSDRQPGRSQNDQV